ncbi:hypothetical protein EAH89_05875 [Roseomonas nepalensis]|uniref:Uncharacterized protein n=1 Tax=Muricoccus nepalensis TaxID=1854500 RepID=A0A502GCU6_9PROT|nr:hypothetical protein [Roseomonas nepalensis]TPG59755.1 hypothetical protein EAH89_05875 [Roseomonas nepalensis]
MNQTPRLSLLALLLLLSACEAAVVDPYLAEGRWRPSGVNEANLRAMVANPGHLVSGQGPIRVDAQSAAAAVARYRADQVRPLPRTSSSDIGVEIGGANGR